MSMRNGMIIGRDVTIDRYKEQSVPRGDPRYIIGRSDLIEVAACPHKWLVGGSEDDDDTSATLWGSLIDSMVFNGDMSAFVTTPETYTATPRKGETVQKPWNWNATVCQEWREQNAGKRIVGHAIIADAERAAGLFLADPEIAEMLDRATFQVHVTASYHDQATGLDIPVKGLIDAVPNAKGKFGKALVDGKTCRDGSLEKWPRVCFDSGYHIQAALYMDIWNAACITEKRISFLHAIQENIEPFEVGRRELGDQFIRLGRAQYMNALAVYAQCLKSGMWPGLDDAGRWSTTECEPWMLMRAGVAPTDSKMPF